MYVQCTCNMNLDLLHNNEFTGLDIIIHVCSHCSHCFAGRKVHFVYVKVALVEVRHRWKEVGTKGCRHTNDYTRESECC